MATTSSTYFNKINVDYPNAGRNNDSQGFRDNFKNIKNALAATDTDVEYLKVNAVKLGDLNDFGYNTIKNASLQSSAIKLYNNTANTISGNISIDYRDGNYQKFTLNTGSSTLSVTNWPTSTAGVGNLTLSIKVPNATTTTAATVTFGGNVLPIGNVTLPASVTTSTVQFFDLWTDDGGTTLYVAKKGV